MSISARNWVSLKRNAFPLSPTCSCRHRFGPFHQPKVCVNYFHGHGQPQCWWSWPHPEAHFLASTFFVVIARVARFGLQAQIQSCRGARCRISSRVQPASPSAVPKSHAAPGTPMHHTSRVPPHDYVSTVFVAVNQVSNTLAPLSHSASAPASLPLRDSTSLSNDAPGASANASARPGSGRLVLTDDISARRDK